MRYLNYAGYLAIPLAYVVHYWLGHGRSWEPSFMPNDGNESSFRLASIGRFWR